MATYIFGIICLVGGGLANKQINRTPTAAFNYENRLAWAGWFWMKCALRAGYLQALGTFIFSSKYLNEIKSMLQSSQTSTSQMTFSEVIDRLTQNDMVDGLLVIGSAGEDKLTPASDYDLVVILNENHLPLHVGVTYIDHRFTDLIFLTTEQIEQVLSLDDPIDSDEWAGRIIRWLETGIVTFDRRGQIAQAQQKIKRGQWLRALDETDGYGPWFRVNYNLAQNKRMLASDDPVYQMAVDLRVALYGPADLLFSYFTIRNLLWAGEKEAIRYLMANDPAYLDLFQAFIFEADRLRKFEWYESLAEITVAPFGTIWQDNVTVIGFDQKVGLEMVEEVSNFWDSLVLTTP